MRSIVVIALLALLPCHVFAQTSAASEVYALDAVSDHTARVGASNLFVYQTKGGSLGKFLLGGAFFNSHSIEKQSQSVANSINGDSTALDFAAIGKTLEERAAGSPIAKHAVLVSVDSDGITRATLVVNVRDGSERGTNYYYHFKPTLQNSELQSEAGPRSSSPSRPNLPPPWTAWSPQ